MDQYRLSLLEYEDCPVRFLPAELELLLQAWRKGHPFRHVCLECEKPVSFRYTAYGTCCDTFYYNDLLSVYPVTAIAVATPGYTFLLPQLQRMIQQARIATNQEFLVLPDPIYWQVTTTLTYGKIIKFVQGKPMTRRTKQILPPSKAAFFYKQIQEAPLNYGSLESRSCGKATLMRQVAFGKRCRYSMRGMIVPDASLRPNEIRIPDAIVDKFGLRGKWVLLNRMPSLQPENFVGLHVPREGPSWPHDCFGIPLEILQSINGDFDGDEVNIYLVPSLLSQTECATLLNPECEMRSFVMGLKLAPCQDMWVAYYLFRDQIDFLPLQLPDLKDTFQTICELYGSAAAFEAFDAMRRFYREVFQTRYCFALTWHEMETLAAMLERGEDITQYQCCLTIQPLSKAKGNFESLRQMFGCVGLQSGEWVDSSFLAGLQGKGAVAHGHTAITALYLVSHIWLPGYGYQKLMANGHGMVVTYAGSIMDGTQRIIFKDALDAYHPEDILSESTFRRIVQSVLIEKDLSLSAVDIFPPRGE